jgi:glycosyltransferase involved in cell wall biosynthesis
LREVYSLMKAADVGVSVLHPIKNYLTSLPIKVFEYMAAPLPAVVSDFPYWRGIFDQCALFADPERPESLAAAIVEILERPNATADMVRRGCALIEREYNWEREAAKLLHVYQSLTT